jgi:nitrogen-specific signal transduction histidine kinase
LCGLLRARGCVVVAVLAAPTAVYLKNCPLVTTGSGAIPPDVLPHLFDPFRGGGQQAGRSDGLGLGLYIVSQIVQAHGGTVDVKTGDGDTAFYVRLPRGEP